MALTKPNLMIVGASGGVANALLHHLVVDRDLFGKLVLVDRNAKVLDDIYINHGKLDYTFVHQEFKFPENTETYHRLLKEHDVRIVLDITDGESIPFLEATNAAGASYVNTGLNADGKSIPELVIEVFDRKNEFNGASHIVCSGMNPGVVNLWTTYGIEKFGRPNEIIEFEYDTSKSAKKWHPMMTWSAHEFIEECINDAGGIMLGRGLDKVRELKPNALENRKSLHSILEPIMKLSEYPEGMLTPHEEMASLAQKYDIPTQYIYAINPRTMKELIRLYEKDGKVSRHELELGDNTNDILDGADNIGILLNYDDKKVYYFNTIPSVAIIGTNATYTQVVIGIMAGLHVLLLDNLAPGAYFPEDLHDTCYKQFIFDNMRVQEFVFDKNESGHLKFKSFNPMLKSRRKNYTHDYVI